MSVALVRQNVNDGNHHPGMKIIPDGNDSGRASGYLAEAPGGGDKAGFSRSP
jgi:hypothetical protein